VRRRGPALATAVLCCAAAVTLRAEAPTPIVRPIGGLRAETAALLARGGQGGNLRMALAAVPLAADGAAKLPVLVIVELDGEPLLAGFPGGRLGVEVSSYVVASDGRVVESRNDGVAVDIGAGSDLEKTGLRYLERLDLDPGAYSVRVLARLHRTGAFALRTVDVTLPETSAPRRVPSPRSWIDALAPGLEAADLEAFRATGGIPAALAAAAATAPATGETALESASSLPARLVPFLRAYSTSFAELADGRSATAVASLREFEANAVTFDPGHGMGNLQRIDGNLLVRIASADRQALLPVGLFYEDLSRAHVETGHIGLARRAADMAERALDGFARAGRDEARLAGKALDGLAAEYIELNAPGRAIAVLQHATEIDPDRVTRWLALTVMYENDWRMVDAEKAVRRALAAAPRDREARLRSARLSAVRIAAVAAEERARIDFDSGHPELAVPMLERQVARLPDEPSLGVALAYARLLSGARAAALDAAERAALADRAYRVAPRRRYSEPPIAALRAGRNEAERAAMFRLDPLRAALAQGGSK
jgi:tetratricopeptide (TPR) repeat protein